MAVAPARERFARRGSHLEHPQPPEHPRSAWLSGQASLARPAEPEQSALPPQALLAWRAEPTRRKPQAALDLSPLATPALPRRVQESPRPLEVAEAANGSSVQKVKPVVEAVKRASFESLPR